MIEVSGLGQILIAALAAFLTGVVICPVGLPWLRRLKFGQAVRDDGPQSHLKKSGTPTMGGIMIILAFCAGLVYCFRTTGPEVFAVLLAVAGFGFIGLCDDLLKIRRRKSLGLRAWQKILMQIAVSCGVLFVMHSTMVIGFGEVILPFAGVSIYLDVFYIPLAILVFIATTNGANLADGLDGHLASITAVMCIFFADAALMGVSSNAWVAPSVGAMLGALLAFLVFNSHPASMFMGDTGSMAIGGFVAAVALVLGLPLFLFFVAIVYVAESVSVILQVGYFKLTKRRLFKMAPVHHAFELSGYSETKIVWVSVVITAIGCIVGMLALIGMGNV